MRITQADVLAQALAMIHEAIKAEGRDIETYPIKDRLRTARVLARLEHKHIVQMLIAKGKEEEEC
jgi:hypothetical protein